MIKTTLKRIFAIVGSSLAIIAAEFYLILSIKAISYVSSWMSTTENVFLILSFLLSFALAFFFTFFGIKALFGFLNKEGKDEPFVIIALCFSAFQFIMTLFTLIFFGSAAILWLLLVFSLVATITLLLHVTGLRVTLYTDVVGITASLVTAVAAAVTGDGLTLAANVIIAISFFAVMSIFALHLIKDAPAEEPKTENSDDFNSEE